MPPKPRGTWYERLRQQWVDRAARRMYDRLAADPASYRAAPSTLAASVVALLILVALGGLLVVLVLATIDASGAEWVLVVAGWAVLLAVRPRIPRLPSSARVLESTQYPALHALVRQMAVAVGTPAPTVVAVDLDFNAYVTSVGIRGRTAMVLGLPFMTMLSWPARLGVIGHELGHLRGRDTRRGSLIGAATGAVAGLHYLLAPSDDDLYLTDPYGSMDAGSPGFAEAIARAAQWVLAAPFLLLLILLERLRLTGGQHREYLADRRAAEVVGTEAATEDLYLEIEPIVTALTAAVRRGEDPFGHLASRPMLTSSQRAARLDELSAIPRSVDATHPPNDLRIRLLLADPRPPSPASPTEVDCARAEQELVQLRSEATKEFSQALIHGPYD
jgi:Zn-dependent protease with chaperone function